jgi:hypothetical protein
VEDHGNGSNRIRLVLVKDHCKSVGHVYFSNGTVKPASFFFFEQEDIMTAAISMKM